MLVLGGSVIWIRGDALTGSERADDRNSRGSPVLIGAGLAGFELLTAFLYFAALVLIIGSSASNTGKLFLLLLYCVVYTLPLIGIAVVFAVMGRSGEAKLRPVGDWLLAHWPVIVGPLALAIGLAVMTFGIIQLTSI